MRQFCVVLLIGFLLTTSWEAVVLADDVLAPVWRGAPGTTWAEWDNWNVYPGPMTPDNGAWPDGFTAPKGWTYENTSMYQNYASRTRVLGLWGEWGPMFTLDNFDDDNDAKHIRVQITWYNDGDCAIPDQIRVYKNQTGGTTITGDPDEFVNLLPDENKILDNNWMVSAFDITLDENPDLETIRIGAGEGGADKWWYIDQVVIDTLCGDIPVPVPEPTSLLLWASLGGIGVICMRRRSIR